MEKGAFDAPFSISGPKISTGSGERAAPRQGYGDGVPMLLPYLFTSLAGMVVMTSTPDITSEAASR